MPALSSPNFPDLTAIEDELTDILCTAGELSNTQAAKGVIARVEQHVNEELPEFLAFFRESWSFVVKCEVICRKMIVGLRGVVVSQVCHLISRSSGLIASTLMESHSRRNTSCKLTTKHESLSQQELWKTNSGTSQRSLPVSKGLPISSSTPPFEILQSWSYILKVTRIPRTHLPARL